MKWQGDCSRVTLHYLWWAGIPVTCFSDTVMLTFFSASCLNMRVLPIPWFCPNPVSNKLGLSLWFNCGCEGQGMLGLPSPRFRSCPGSSLAHRVGSWSLGFGRHLSWNCVTQIDGSCQRQTNTVGYFFFTLLLSVLISEKSCGPLLLTAQYRRGKLSAADHLGQAFPF